MLKDCLDKSNLKNEKVLAYLRKIGRNSTKFSLLKFNILYAKRKYK